jgi:hypothetical protein
VGAEPVGGTDPAGSGTALVPAAEPAPEQLADADAGFGAPSEQPLSPVPTSAEESPLGGFAGGVEELARGAAALAGRLGEMAERAAEGLGKQVNEALKGAPVAIAERLGELAGGSAALADSVQAALGAVAGKVADAVGGAVSALLDGAPARGPPGPQNAPLLPPAAPAPGAPASPGGTSSGPSLSNGSGGHHDDLPLEELAVVLLAALALMQGGKPRPLSGSLLGPASAFLPTTERPG